MQTNTNKGTVASGIAALKTQYGNSNTWSQNDWTTRKSDFLAQYPGDTTASTQFDAMFPKPAAQKGIMTIINNTLGQGLQDIMGLIPKSPIYFWNLLLEYSPTYTDQLKILKLKKML